MIEIDERLFLRTLDHFRSILVPVMNAERNDEGLPPLTEQEIIDEFLDRRKQLGMNDQ